MSPQGHRTSGRRVGNLGKKELVILGVNDQMSNRANGVTLDKKKGAREPKRVNMPISCPSAKPACPPTSNSHTFLYRHPLSAQPTPLFYTICLSRRSKELHTYRYLPVVSPRLMFHPIPSSVHLGCCYDVVPKQCFGFFMVAQSSHTRFATHICTSASTSSLRYGCRHCGHWHVETKRNALSMETILTFGFANTTVRVFRSLPDAR